MDGLVDNTKPRHIDPLHNAKMYGYRFRQFWESIPLCTSEVVNHVPYTSSKEQVKGNIVPSASKTFILFSLHVIRKLILYSKNVDEQHDKIMGNTIVPQLFPILTVAIWCYLQANLKPRFWLVDQWQTGVWYQPHCPHQSLFYISMLY